MTYLNDEVKKLIARRTKPTLDDVLKAVDVKNVGDIWDIFDEVIRQWNAKKV